MPQQGLFNTLKGILLFALWKSERRTVQTIYTIYRLQKRRIDSVREVPDGGGTVAKQLLSTYLYR